MQKQIHDKLYSLHEHNIDPNSREIYLFGEEIYNNEDMSESGVEYIMANRFIKNLNSLSYKSSDPILIHMKTCGGYWEEGMAIYDTIKMCPNHITILNYTHARSMSSLIFLAADKRVMMPNSTYMFHQGTLAVNGTYKQVVNEVNESIKSNDIMLNIYIDAMKKSGSKKSWSKKRIREWLEFEMNKKEDVHFNSDEAVKLGFADYIFDGNYKKLKSI